jgi:hypothetical protein
MRFRLVAIPVMAVLVVGCSSLLDLGSYSVGNADSGAMMGTEAGADVVVAAQECTTNAECISKLGDFSICRKIDFKCAKLLSPDCPQVLGNWKDDNAVILGSILPIIGPDKSGGIPLLDAIAVGIDDFTSGANGLPPILGGSVRRPIAVVGCSEESDDPNDSTAPVRTAKHLVEDVKVPAIIGASFSGDTQQSAQVTIPAGVLLMSPTATSVAITDLQDNGLVWRTSPSDVIQVKALVALMPQIESATRKRLVLGSDVTANPLRVAILNKGDSYGKGLASALQTSLVFNGKPALDNANSSNLKVIDYGDPSAGSIDYSVPRGQIIDNLSTFAPNVVFLLGTNEVVPEFLVHFEAPTTTWPNNAYPTYLFPDGGLVPELWTAIGTTTDLRKRVFGTIPGTDNAIFKLFRNRYNAFVKDGTTADVGGTAATYDAFYLLMYAIAAIADKPLTGANINEGLKRLVPPGPESDPGESNINTAFSILASGKNIDYNGASGPLDFDVVTGEAPSDIQIWCIPTVDKTVNGAAGPGINSGIFYDATKSALSGPILDPPDAALKATCNF